MDVGSFDPEEVISDNGNYFGMPLRPEDSALVLISAPWDVTVSYRAGTSYAPDAIIDVSRQIDFYDPAAPDAWRKGIATAPIDYSIQDVSHRLRRDAERVIANLEEGGSRIIADEFYARKVRKINEASAEVNGKIFAQSQHWLAEGRIVGLQPLDGLRFDTRRRRASRLVRRVADRRALRPEGLLRGFRALACLHNVERAARCAPDRASGAGRR